MLMLDGAPLQRGGFEADSLRLVGQRGALVERLSASTSADLFPQWSGAGYADGYFNPQAGYVDSGRAVERYKQEAVAAGGSGHASKFAPVLGEIIADVVEDKPNPTAKRFAWRAPGDHRTEPTRRRSAD